MCLSKKIERKWNKVNKFKRRIMAKTKKQCDPKMKHFFQINEHSECIIHSPGSDFFLLHEKLKRANLVTSKTIRRV